MNFLKIEIQNRCRDGNFLGPLLFFLFFSGIFIEMLGHKRVPFFHLFYHGFLELNTGIHELGHIVFMIFTKNIVAIAAAGTLFQLIFPIFYFFLFLFRRKLFHAIFAILWIATQFFHISKYIASLGADTPVLVFVPFGKIQKLPEILEENDWTIMLGHFGIADKFKIVEKIFFFGGIFLMILGFFAAFFLIGKIFFSQKKPEKSAKKDFQKETFLDKNFIENLKHRDFQRRRKKRRDKNSFL